MKTTGRAGPRPLAHRPLPRREGVHHRRSCPFLCGWSRSGPGRTARDPCPQTLRPGAVPRAPGPDRGRNQAASGLEEQYPASHRLEVELIHQPWREPPTDRRGVVTEVRLIDETELKGHVGRLDRVDGTERGVSLLPRTHRLSGFAQPPQRFPGRTTPRRSPPTRPPCPMKTSPGRAAPARPRRQSAPAQAPWPVLPARSGEARWTGEYRLCP